MMPTSVYLDINCILGLILESLGHLMSGFMMKSSQRQTAMRLGYLNKRI
jgi:hypothetical protein